MSLAGLVAGLVDGLQDDAERLLVGPEVGREAALIAHGGGEAALGENLLQMVEHLGAIAQRLAEARRADGQDHELLDVEAVVGMRAAVDDVHHRHGHHRLAPGGEALREVAVERQPRIARRGMGGRERDGEDGIGAEATFVLGAVELDHAADRCRPGRARRRRARRTCRTVLTCSTALSTPLPR